MDGIKKLLNKVPYPMLALIYGAYLGLDYYDFTTSASSPLIIKQGQVKATQAEKERLDKQVADAERFLRSIETKRIELRQLSTELAAMQGDFTEFLDVPGFLKMLSTEAKKIGLRVQSIRPAKSQKEEFFVAHHFDVEFGGVYAQVVGFLQRMSQVQNIVRVDTLDMKRSGSPDKPLVELKGTVRVTAFTYNRSLADEKAKELISGKGSG